MKKLTLALIAFSLIGCTTVKTYDSPPQSYRAPMTEKSLNITGNLKQSRYDGITSEITNELFVYFDNELQINGLLTKNIANGDIYGKEYNGKKTSASCATKMISKTMGETRCMIFIDNERIATLTM